MFASVSTFFGSLFDNFDVVEMTYDGTLQQRTMISRVDAFQIKGYFLFAVKSRVRMRVINKYSDRTTCSGYYTIIAQADILVKIWSFKLSNEVIVFT